MTAGRFGEVDLDLLADFLGGALEGTPEEAAVARLITEDPSWIQAHAALAPAVGGIRASLADWGVQPEPMPSEVADRLGAALAGASPLIVDAGDTPATAAVLPDHSRRQLRVVPGENRGGAARSVRRWWPRWAGAVAVAAAIAAFAGFGASQLLDGDGARDAAGTALHEGSANAPAATSGAAPQALAESSGERLLATGTDYGRRTIAGTLNSLGLRATAATRGAGDYSAPAAGAEAGPTAAGLERLSGPAARAACLDAVAAAHARGPVVVDLVDYASFEGSPALVVSFVDRAGERWAWVAGPRCGQPQSGADTRYSTRVG